MSFRCVDDEADILFDQIAPRSFGHAFVDWPHFLVPLPSLVHRLRTYKNSDVTQRGAKDLHDPYLLARKGCGSFDAKDVKIFCCRLNQ